MRNHIYQLICDEKTYISVGSEGRRDRSIRDKEPGGWPGHLASFLNVSGPTNATIVQMLRSEKAYEDKN